MNLTRKAEEMCKRFSSAFFIIMFVFQSFIFQSAFAQDETATETAPEKALTRETIGFPSFTPQYSIQNAEGELFLFIGDERKPMQPQAWQSTDPGKIRFSVEDRGVRLTYHIAYAETLSASQPVSGTVVHCTAETVSNKEENVVVWMAWRYHNCAGHSSFGMVLHQQVRDAIEVTNHPDSWSPHLTWYFRNHAFLCDDSVLYWIKEKKDWSVAQFVRDGSPPYPELESTHWIGWTALSALVKPNQHHSFSIEIPYTPIEKKAYFSEFADS